MFGRFSGNLQKEVKKRVIKNKSSYYFLRLRCLGDFLATFKKEVKKRAIEDEIEPGLPGS